eukprot:6097733-Alexandrium_andersonii.AAC.1
MRRRGDLQLQLLGVSHSFELLVVRGSLGHSSLRKSENSDAVAQQQGCKSPQAARPTAISSADWRQTQRLGPLFASWW